MGKPLYILNGPNLNLLGTREPDVYGTTTLADIEAQCRAKAPGCEFRQTNSEGDLVSLLHEAGEKGSAAIVNPGAYTHTSIALMDAAQAVAIPVIEIHLSQTAAREGFRHTSYLARAAHGTISGFGAASYALAIDAALNLVEG